MIAIKCVNGKVIGLTNHKKELLDNEYSEFNRLACWVSECYRQGIDEFIDYGFIKNKFNLYSLTKTQVLRNCLKIKGEQPLMITKQSVKIMVNDNKLTPLWVRIAVHDKRGGIWLPIKMSKRMLNLIKENKIRGVRIIKLNSNYYISITIQKEVVMKSYSNILAVDLGERYMAVVSGTAQKKPLFLGKNVRGIRRHYAWLRKRLGNKKLLKKIKQVGHKESDKVNSVLHGISKEIVKLAIKTNSTIVLGNLKGIRKKNRGKKLNRIVSNMPYFKLTQMIIYKAKWEGIKVKKVSEAYTSRTCSKCGYCDKNNRKTQGRFKCRSCGLELNADYNATKNIIKRSLGQRLSDRVIAYAQKPSNDLVNII